MKKLFFTLCMFMAVASFAQSSEYREGFKDGYCEGWRDVKGQYAYCPYAPYPTLVGWGRNNYRGGYTAGFKKGRRAAY